MEKNSKKNKTKNMLYFISVIFVITVLFNVLNGVLFNKSKIEKITYTEFLQMVDEEKVDTIYYNESNDWMTITLFNDETKEMTIEERKEYKDYTDKDKLLVQYPGKDGNNFRERMLEKNVIIEMVAMEKTPMEKLLSVVQVLITVFWLVLIFVMLKSMSGASGSAMSLLGVDTANELQSTNVKFSDVKGHDEIIDDFEFIKELIKKPEIGDEIGAKVPKGILLSGDPGCGKTLIAKALAGETGVKFIYKNGSSFIDRFVGVGAKNVREAFKFAKKNAPCILFIDEIDAIGGNRDGSASNSEHTQTIDALLQEMDGFNGREGVFVIAATNKPESLDKALTRAGRFDRQIVVAAPKNWQIRKELFDHYLEKIKTNDNIDVENLSKQTVGFTGADIAAICNEAAIIAIMNNKTEVDYECIEEAIDKKVFKGNRSKKEQYFEDKKIVAYHEAGHAVMSYLLGEPIARASIQSTISGVGGAVFNAEKESIFQTNKDFENDILICYAGRASEAIKYHDVVTTGASNDITQATHTMKLYIERLGFDEDSGLLDISVLTSERLISSEEITKKMSAMSKRLYDKCKTMLEEKYTLVECLAQKLLEVETLTGEEIRELLEDSIEET